MPFYMISSEEIQKMIDEDLDDGEAHVFVMQHILKMTKGPYTVFYNKETEKFFAVEKGQPIPLHIQEMPINRH